MRKKVMMIIGIVLAIVAVLVLAVVIGLRVQPAPFPNYPERTPALETIPLPEDLPAPVARYYRAIIGDDIPVVTSAVITTRAQLRVMGITFPSRFRFTHDAGQGYRHYIESTVFGQPLLKVNERYLEGVGRMELPVGIIEDDPKTNDSANLGLWGESIWLPSIFLTDPRVRWEAIDDTHASVTVPFEDGEQTFTVTFDAQTGLISRMETMRWKNENAEARTRWILEPYGWAEFEGVLIPSPAGVTWEDEGTPWLVVTIEDLVYNVDVAQYIRGRGL